MKGSDSQTYWDQRAIRYGGTGGGLAAVCSYGMPAAYNHAIHISQNRSLTAWLRSCRGVDVLDVGCGVGRWSLQLAEQGNRVTGVDISPAMIALAKRRAAEAGIESEFLVQDVAFLDLHKQFDFVLAVTVLQHILHGPHLEAAIRNLARHLKPNGVLVLLEVAPSKPTTTCNSAVFEARSLASYEQMLRNVGLRIVATRGVDTAILRRLLLPAMNKFPTKLARAVATTSAFLSLPMDFIAGRYFKESCWHKVIAAVPSQGPH